MAPSLLLVCLFWGAAAQRPCRGCPSEQKPADEMIGGVFSAHGADFKVEAAAVAAAKGQNLAMPEFTPLAYKEQHVAGTALFVRVRIANASFLDARIFEPLPHTKLPPVLEDAKFGVKETDEITTWWDDAKVALTEHLECGGCLSPEMPPDNTLRAVLASGAPQLEFEAHTAAEKLGRNSDTFKIFEPIRYSYRWVAGRYFYLKMQVGEQEYMDLAIFQPLKYTGSPPSVVGVAIGVERDAPIKDFGHGVAIVA